MFHEYVLSESKKYNSIEEPKAENLPRKRNQPNYATLQIMDINQLGPSSSYHSPTVDSHYRIIYFEALYLIISSLNDRFDQSTFQVHVTSEHLLLSVINTNDVPDSGIQLLKETYSKDINIEALSTEFHILKQLCSKTDIACFHDVHEFLKTLNVTDS